MMQNPVSLQFPSRVVPCLLVATFLLLDGISCRHTSGQDFGNPFGAIDSNQATVKLTSSFKLKPGSQFGQLFVRADIADGYHIYSVTQPKGGTLPTKIDAAASEQFKITGAFVPDSPPHVDDSKEVYDVNVESHEKRITWSAPIRISDGVDAKTIKIQLTVKGQVCKDSCDLFDVKSTAKFAGYDDQIEVKENSTESTGAEFTPKNSHVLFSAKIVNQKNNASLVKPGDTVRLEFTAKPTDGHHIYQYLETVDDKYQNATLFAFLPPGGWKVSKAIPSVKPYENKQLEYFGHKDPVTFSFDIAIPSDAEPDDHELEGVIGFQTCTDQNCDAPSGLRFQMIVPVGREPFQPHVKFIEEIKESVVRERVIQGWRGSEKPTADGSPSAAAAKPVTPKQIDEMKSLYDPASKVKYIHFDEMDSVPVGSYRGGSESSTRPETTIFMAAIGMFLGGFLLNLMPCVFPVLGLKVMGFVEQAGSDPRKIRMHGIVFSLGLVVSMWVLAGFILTLKLAFGRNVSWGAEQMGNPYFLLGIIVMLFLLGLNMAGVFELGTSLTRVGGSVDQKKGYLSSFMTGILTTIIATPCSGPFLGTAMGFTFNQTVQVAMLLFTIFALGIASPYIVLTLFPSLIGSLPRPGAWMHTFKVMMAFAMFATVAFFMQSFGGQVGVDGLAWLVMALVVIALAAFFYGTWSPAYVKPFKRMAFGWMLPCLVLAAGIWMGYDAAGYQNTATDNLKVGDLVWNKWYPGTVEYSLKQQPKIIWTDYTAKWCLTCQTNKKTVFSSTEVKNRIKELNVELIKVDKTSNPPEIAIDMARSGQVAIPVNIIYPPNYPEEPAVLLNGIVTPGMALKIFDRMEAIQNRLDNSSQTASKVP
jgi:thiol:disulfide interchange protein DsbD